MKKIEIIDVYSTTAEGRFQSYNEIENFRLFQI